MTMRAGARAQIAHLSRVVCGPVLRALTMLTLAGLPACGLPGAASPTASPAKIAFSLGGIGPDGLVGSPGALRSLDYEFCIPDDEAKVREVRAIAPAVRVMRGSRGRIGCASAQILCVNSTHSAAWRDELLRLAALPYIARIQETVWE